MKRRSFLQSIGAGIAALFVPVAARQTAPARPAYLTDPDTWHLIDYPNGGINPGDLSEQALEDMVIEIQKSDQRISIMPTTVTYWRPW